MNSDSHKDPKEKIVRLLGDNEHRNPFRRYGTQKGRMVPCSRSPRHGHHPESESCDICLSWLEQIAERKRKDESYRK